MYGCTNKGKGDSVTVSEREGRKVEGRDGWRGERGKRKGGRREGMRKEGREEGKERDRKKRLYVWLCAVQSNVSVAKSFS